MRRAHLAKLADYGYIEWNTHEVSKGPNFDEIRPLLELLDNHEDELPEHCSLRLLYVPIHHFVGQHWIIRQGVFLK